MAPAGVQCGGHARFVLALNNRQAKASEAAVCNSHLKQLSRLTDALEQASEPTVAREPVHILQNLESLKQKWRAQDEPSDVPSEQDGDEVLPGVIRRDSALEIDLSRFDENFDAEEEEVQDMKRVPREVQYFDTARIHVRSGDGGTGCCAFRREKFISHGGPAGGNGGHGGSVWVVAEEGMNSLLPFRNSVHWKAKPGVNGSGKNMHGANGEDLYIHVPPGIIIKCHDAEEGEPPVAELMCDGDKALIVQGGRGGRGNAAFKSSRNKAPVIAEDGEHGLGMWLSLELKLIADVGIIGMPSAGKSSLLAMLSDARPKVAAYHFTTIVPNLGVCEFDLRTTVFADVPGLIVGAHKGKGLGHTFLRHVSRARALVHVLDGTSPDPISDFGAIRRELGLVGGGAALSRKPYIVAYNKVDIPDSGDYIDEVIEALHQGWGLPRARVVPVSAATGEGVIKLVRRVREMLDSMPQVPNTLETDALNVQEKDETLMSAARLDEYDIEALPGGQRTWIVHGAALERFAQMTNWDYFEAVLRFQNVLKACGLWKTLEKRGVMEGDTVVIGELEFRWSAEQREGQLYELWVKDLAARGKVGKGSTKWPHMSG